jgi:hypothetical protein
MGDALHVQARIPVYPGTAGGGKPFRCLIEGEAHQGELLVKKAVVLLDGGPGAAESLARAIYQAEVDNAKRQGHNLFGWDQLPEGYRESKTQAAALLLEQGVIDAREPPQGERVGDAVGYSREQLEGGTLPSPNTHELTEAAVVDEMTRLGTPKVRVLVGSGKLELVAKRLANVPEGPCDGVEVALDRSLEDTAWRVVRV